MTAPTTLGTKLNLLLLTVFIVGTILTWCVAAWMTRRQTEQEISDRAALLLQATEGVRTYTSTDVGKILLTVQQQTKTFLPETVPAFSARTVFEHFRGKGFEEFFYKEASSNPTNVKDDKADTFEEGVLAALRKDPKLSRISGYREDFGGQRRFFTAQAMRLEDVSCLRCHSTPDKAPPEMVQLYGDKNGYNWQLGDVIATRVVYVPAGHVAAASQKAALWVTACFVLLFGALMGAINLLLRNNVVRPIRVLTDAARAISHPGEEADSSDHFSRTDAGKALEAAQARLDELGELAGGFLHMAAEVRQREHGLRQAKSQIAQREAYFRALIENASVAYVILDSRYTIRYASPLVKNVLHAEPAEITGKLILTLVVDDNQRPMLDAIERAEHKKGTSDPFVFKRAQADSGVRIIEAVVTNLLDQPAIKGLVMVLRDVTERKRLEELEVQQKQLKEATGAGMIVPQAVPAPALPLATENPAAIDPVLVTKKLIDLFPTLPPEQQHAILSRLVAAGLATGAKRALPAAGITTLRTKYPLNETEAVDPGRLIELFLLLADFAVALDTLVWNTWKTLAPESDIRRAGSGSTASQGSMPLRKLFAAYLGTESTIPRGQVAYDLERSRALLAALIASIGQVGQEFAKRWREKFEPAEIERRAANGHGLLTSKDARAWRAYRDLANETSAAQMEKEVLAGLATYAESLLKSIR